MEAKKDMSTTGINPFYTVSIWGDVCIARPG